MKLYTNEPVCPKCRHHNAMLDFGGREKDSAGGFRVIRRCRDCGHTAKWTDKICIFCGKLESIFCFQRFYIDLKHFDVCHGCVINLVVETINKSD